MRAVFIMLLFLGCPGIAFSHGADGTPMEKVKTGILPSGGFYSIYEVVCQDQTLVSIASTLRGRRWCASYQGHLNCFARLSDATGHACANDDLASTDERILDQTGSFESIDTTGGG